MKIWHSKCHLCICKCRFVLLLTTLSWLTVAFFAAVWGRAVFPGGPLGLFVARNIGMRAWGIIGYKSVIPSATGISAWPHSASPRLLRTKRGLMGVHATKLQSKGIRQGDSRLLAAACSPTKNRLCFLLLYFSFYMPFALLSQKTNLSHWNTSKSRASRMMYSWLRIWHIYIAKVVMWITAWWLNCLNSLDQLKSSQPHVSCIASFQKLIYST